MIDEALNITVNQAQFTFPLVKAPKEYYLPYYLTQTSILYLSGSNYLSTMTSTMYPLLQTSTLPLIPRTQTVIYLVPQLLLPSCYPLTGHQCMHQSSKSLKYERCEAPFTSSSLLNLAIAQHQIIKDFCKFPL